MAINPGGGCTGGATPVSLSCAFTVTFSAVSLDIFVFKC